MTGYPPDDIQIHITADGVCIIDEEYFAPPPGSSLADAVLGHLRLEAAALETPVRAVIHDEQAQYTTTIRVNTDGTSSTLDTGILASAYPDSPPPEPARPSTPDHHAEEPVPPARPHEALPEPYRRRLAAICETANTGHLTKAGQGADQLLAELSSKFGPSHLYTLAVGSVRGDIAWLTRDFRYGLRSWTFTARAWHLHLGPNHPTTIRAVGNAFGCWLRLQPSDAKETGPALVAFLQDVSFPDEGAAIRTVRQRITLAN
ncbi:MAG TPA: hypothetical protein VIU15_13380 [Streptomyces sp.]